MKAVCFTGGRKAPGRAEDGALPRPAVAQSPAVTSEGREVSILENSCAVSRAGVVNVLAETVGG